MLEFILDVIIDGIFCSLPGKIFCWLFSIIFFAMGMYVYQTGETETADWLMIVCLIFTIIAILLTAFGKRKNRQ